jgi:hypothetical protein
VTTISYVDWKNDEVLQEGASRSDWVWISGCIKGVHPGRRQRRGE